ncbi:hypothetical protein [Deinococcus soli (ex Cha et al. 2016)]|uniref:Uncharacterized protein n=2 Tax=Deinococcus soli (ex Cha et al. 2016) TaxID=1309411 RepID=A0ACC6KHT8_9DEIO|nr:hypothetical protein [Deinococcus soli (ex Cha et al. 2016)]MDR6218765.1 hypothetical protein [Deinococcus soli (ex Cha et al. 2016)]MDR6328562.1 hypothetical protein [Deinococcus soli (ex Cha et al. 2016)]MDR6751951.1 hypothetical protein [Deinococcus soli (ex Cha et al. 2016)]
MTDPIRTHRFIYTPASGAARQYTTELLPSAPRPLHRELISGLHAFLEGASAERERLAAALNAQIQATETLEADGARPRVINAAYDQWRALKQACDAHAKRVRDSEWLIRFYARVDELAATGLDASWDVYVTRTQAWVQGDPTVPFDDFERDAAAGATATLGFSCVLQGWTFLDEAA